MDASRTHRPEDIRWVSTATAATVMVLLNQGEDGLRAVRHYADALDEAADEMEEHHKVSEETTNHLADALLDIVERRIYERRRP